MSEVTVSVMAAELAALQERSPAQARRARKELFALVQKRGGANLAGGVLRDTGPNRDLARYFAATLRRTMADDGITLEAGLPGDEEMARIIASREHDTTITPHQNRPNPHLRIPLPPALTQRGYDRLAGVALRHYSRSPFKLIPAPRAPKASAVLVPREQWERARGKDAKRKVKAWYALCKSVLVKGRPVMETTMAEVQAEVPAVMLRALDRIYGRVKK